MKQRFLALLCCLTLAFFCLPVPTAQASSVVFSRTRSYQASFSDLSADRWYYPYAVALYEYGLSEGREGGVFAASEEITVAELLTFSARVRSCYENNGSAVSFPTAAPSEPWYLPY